MNLSLGPDHIEREALAQWPYRLAGRRILVVGDLVLDRYLIGRPTRLSREAPIPVLEFERCLDIPGAAANPAMNLKALGAEVAVAGIAGDDEAGRALLARLSADGIDTTPVVIDPNRSTCTKTRVLADHGLRSQIQVARIDQVDRSPLGQPIEDQLLEKIPNAAQNVEAILVSDYKSGIVNAGVIASCRHLSLLHDLLLTVDSQGDLNNFAGFSLVKANREDTEAMLGYSLATETDFQQEMPVLAERLGAVLVVTRGRDGLSAVAGREYAHIPVLDRSEVYDVTGAGDTVIAVLTLALVAGANLREAAYLANFAAGLVVRRLGNATVTPDELAAAVRSQNPG